MSHYLRRQFVCDRLRLSLPASYRVVGTAYGSLISEDEVVEVLNRSRNEAQPVLQYLPSDIMTLAEIAAIPDVAESGITERDIMNWTKRTRNPVPCFRLNRKQRRIRRSAFLEWIKRSSRIRRRG